MKTKLLSAAISVFLLLSLTACSTPATVKLSSNAVLKERHAAALTLADLPAPQVIVQTGDTLRIVRDAQEPAAQDDMTHFVVRPDGLIALPGIGTVQVGGLTPEQVTDEITQRYAKIYREPQVTVNIAQAPSNRIFVGGAVPNPAFFDLSSAVTLEQALLASGGVLPSAQSKHIALLRRGSEGKYDLYYVSLASMLTDEERPIIALQRGDLIYVPQSRIGATVEAVDMYFTRLFPINKGVGLGFNYDLKSSGVKNSGNTTNTSNTYINP